MESAMKLFTFVAVVYFIAVPHFGGHSILGWVMTVVSYVMTHFHLN